ncbi:GNA1162 family protein [Geomonas agri]|uniref:GNA1162 family protein n=1 Tax=Geomonas agri TaxID=2873702 RepID=UPI001CD44CEA|nr:GNA1162 family protein [Geomonas agri]
MTQQHDKRRRNPVGWLFTALAGLLMMVLGGCATTGDTFRDATMDFGSIKTVAVMPFGNLTRDQLASERVRDVFTTSLMATGAIYSLPVGEVARAIGSIGLTNVATPSSEDVVKLAKALKADAVITGIVREYGDVRSGNASADVISLSLQMAEGQTGRVVWSASTAKGGIGITEKLFGGGGKPLNDVTEKAVNDLINKMFE